MLTNEVLQSVPERIAARLRGELLTGRFAAGEPLREIELAERFGVSRGPIRQVLHQLVQEGLLIAKRNCGVTVAPRPPDSVHELIIPLRVQIETYALRLCFDRLTDEDFQEWEKVLSRMRLACEEHDYPAIVERDCDFHRFLLYRAGLQDMAPIWTLVHSRMRSFCEEGNRRFNEPLHIHAVHSDLLQAIRTGTLASATTALREHIEDGDFNEKSRQRWLGRKNGRKEKPLA